MSENWRQSEIRIVINDKSQGSIAKHLTCDGLLHYIYINESAGERIFKTGKHLAKLLVQNSSKTTKKFFTFEVSTSIRGLHQKKLVLGLLLPVLGAIS